jgi:hypothetical protein
MTDNILPEVLALTLGKPGQQGYTLASAAKTARQLPGRKAARLRFGPRFLLPSKPLKQWLNIHGRDLTQLVVMPCGVRVHAETNGYKCGAFFRFYDHEEAHDTGNMTAHDKLVMVRKVQPVPAAVEPLDYYAEQPSLF